MVCVVHLISPFILFLVLVALIGLNLLHALFPGMHIATGSGGQLNQAVAIWDGISGQLLKRDRQPAVVWSIAFDGSGTRLASCAAEWLTVYAADSVHGWVRHKRIKCPAVILAVVFVPLGAQTDASQMPVSPSTPTPSQWDQPPPHQQNQPQQQPTELPDFPPSVLQETGFDSLPDTPLPHQIPADPIDIVDEPTPSSHTHVSAATQTMLVSLGGIKSSQPCVIEYSDTGAMLRCIHTCVDSPNVWVFGLSVTHITPPNPASSPTSGMHGLVTTYLFGCHVSHQRCSGGQV